MNVDSSPPVSPGRANRTFSFGSNRSSESKSGKPKVTNLHEDSRDKRRLNFTSKADPNRAVTEAQPADQARETTTLQDLRGYQHKDHEGNLITDPDLTNPTRHRLERPLDTIRSFEAAIDNGYKRRSQVQRGQSADAVVSPSSNRRSSNLGGPDAYNQRPFSGAPSSYRPASYRQDLYPPGNAPVRGNPYHRQNTAPLPLQTKHDQGIHPVHSYHESYDAMNTGESSGSQSEPWGNSTDPSSENSSIDRIQPNGRTEYNDAYGSPHGMPMHEAIQEEYAYQGRQQQMPPQPYGRPQQGYRGPPGQYESNGKPMPPLPPQHYPQQPQQRNVIPLGGNTGPAPATNSRLSKQAPPSRGGPQAQPSGEKQRKSWLKRRFSKG